MSLYLRKRAKIAVAKWLARGFRRPRMTPREVVNLTPRRVLIVRQHNQMGDMVCATPTLRALREAYPAAELALVCAPLNWEVVRNHPGLDRVLVFDKKTWMRPHRLWRFWRKLRAFRPDLAFVLNTVSFSGTSVGIALASGAPILVGGDSRPFGWDISRHMYSLEMPTRPNPDQHAVLHSLAPLRAIGITTDDLTTVVVPAEDEREWAAAFLSHLASEEPLWALHPGAGKQENLWPTERFAEVAVRAAAAGCNVLVLQGPADRELMTKFWDTVDAFAAPADRGRILAVPTISVGACAALLVAAERFLCNDTGLMHVAGAVGVRTLALFGPTDPDVWRPLGNHVTSLRGEGGELGSLTVEAVWEALAGLGASQRGSS